MNLRLPFLALLIFSASLVVHAQSLGDVAREVRAEKQQSGAPHSKVITNDDIATSANAPQSAEKEAPPADATITVAPTKDAATKETTKPAAIEGARNETEAKAEPAKEKRIEAKKEDPEKERELREAETRKRSDEINKSYTDRITKIHDQISTAQLLLAKLQAQQIDSTNEFKRTAGMAPTLNEYESQQREFAAQIEIQKSLITSLNSQLDDAREAARHAGVPHALDY
jgi:chromosome segregation ATPase